MSDNYDLRKFGADKIAFLGMFLLAIVIAQLIVSVRSGIKFSEPVELSGTGLSVSIPIGKGWQTTQKWKHSDSAFVLSTNFVTYNKRIPDLAVNCRYFIAAQNITPQDLLDEMAEDPNNPVVETRQIQKENFTIYWAHIIKPFTIFWAVAELPNNRMVTIEVIETTFEIDIAERIFHEVVKSINLTDDNSVKTGMDFVTEIKSNGIDSLINNYNTQSCFFLKDSSKRNIGFTIDLLGDTMDDQQFNIRGASYLFFAGRNAQEQRTLFRCDKNLTKFIWQSKTITRNSQFGKMITLDESGTINVTDDETGESQTYSNCFNVVPSILLESFIAPAVKNNINVAIIDIIDSNGNISPNLFSLKPPDEASQEYPDTFMLESLDGRESPDTFYLNDNYQITKATGNYYLERTDIETIEKEFPDMADSISKMMNLLKANSF